MFSSMFGVDDATQVLDSIVGRIMVDVVYDESIGDGADKVLPDGSVE
jgi:hypothetical protein